MAKKSFFDGLLGKKQSASTKSVKTVASVEPSAAGSETPAESENSEEAIKHLYITEDDKKNKKYKKKAVQKDPRVDTGILRSRIAEKIAKMNNS